MSSAILDVYTDTLPPTQYLLLEVLSARWRLGERIWTFPARFGRSLRALEKLGLVFVMHGVTERTLRAGLTEAGRRATLYALYKPPAMP